MKRNHLEGRIVLRHRLLLVVSSLAAVMLCGCHFVRQDEFNALKEKVDNMANCKLQERMVNQERQVRGIEKDLKNLEGKHTALERKLDSTEKYISGVEAEFDKSIKRLSTTIQGINKICEKALERSTAASSSSMMSTEKVNKIESDMKVYRAGMNESVKKQRQAFTTALTGVEKEFDAKITKLNVRAKNTEDSLKVYYAGVNETVKKQRQAFTVTLTGVGKEFDAKITKLNVRAKNIEDSMKVYHAGVNETVKKQQQAFQSVLAGVEEKFNSKVSTLETRMKGSEAELMGEVKLKLSKNLADIGKMKTVILGHLSKNKQEIIKAKLENMGFSKELKKAMEDMKVLSEGFKAVVDNKVNEMETRYTGVNANMANLRKRVEKYSNQLEKVRKSLAAILGTLSNSEKD